MCVYVIGRCDYSMGASMWRHWAYSSYLYEMFGEQFCLINYLHSANLGCLIVTAPKSRTHITSTARKRLFYERERPSSRFIKNSQIKCHVERMVAVCAALYHKDPTMTFIIVFRKRKQCWHIVGGRCRCSVAIFFHLHNLLCPDMDLLAAYGDFVAGEKQCIYVVCR